MLCAASAVPEPMSLLGIDIGTTGVKAAAIALDGRMLHSAYREYPTLRPRPGWAMLDSQQVVDAAKLVIAQVAQNTPGDPISALCISAMGEAATPVSKDCRILGPCILFSDTRGEQYMAQLRQRISAVDFYRINPNILAGPSYTLPKLLWMREHEPEIYAAADHFLLWGGLLEYLLGAEPVVPYSHASRTLLFDIHRQDWSAKLLEITRIERVKLPACVPAGHIIGQVSGAMAAELGLPENVQIVSGGHDQCCAALGAGAVQPGQAIDGIGTVECITPVYRGIPDADTMLALGLGVEHHVLPDLYVSFLFNQAGTLLRWFRDTFAATEKSQPNLYRRLDSETPTDPTQLFVLPYFEPTGPPDFVADASGAILGLKTATTRGEIYKAMLESITFYFAVAMESLKSLRIDTSHFIATGGGARSDTWLQIKADIMGVPYTRLETSEAGLVGAALLAAHATGQFDIHAALPQWIRPERTFEPDPARHRIYQQRLAQYRQAMARHGISQPAAST